MGKEKRYEEEFFTKIVGESNNLSDIARNLNLKPHYGNRQTIKKYIKLYDLDTSHFCVIYSGNGKNFIKKDLSKILISGSTFNTTNLKNRLYDEGLKERKCEKCGQDENWYGMKMSLILDHINGINDDHRLENLRILCPNCNATLPTHGGKNRNNQIKIKKKFLNKRNNQKKYCNCGNTMSNGASKCSECDSYKQRKAVRPPYKELLEEIKELGYCGTGRKYGVSDNAIRKWKKMYEKYGENY